MKNKLIALTIAVMAMLCVSCAKSNTHEPPANEGLNLQMYTSASHPPLVALVFGDKKYLFMVDTGSQFSYIDDSYLPEDSAFPIGGLESMTVSTYDGESTVAVAGYRLSTDDGIELDVYATDMSTITRQLFIKSGKRIVGIIGNDFLLSNQATVDYSERRLRKVELGEQTTDSIQTNDTAFPHKQELDPADASDGSSLQRAA